MLGALYVPLDLNNKPLLLKTNASLKFILLNQNDAFGQGCRWVGASCHICRYCKPELHANHPSHLLIVSHLNFRFMMKWVYRRS
jgi:hypothetical protein